MKRETNAHINLFGVPIVPSKLIGKVASKFQSKTFSYGGRPYGVGLLVAYWDGEKAKLHEITPAGDQFEYYVVWLKERLILLARELSRQEHTSRTTWATSTTFHSKPWCSMV